MSKLILVLKGDVKVYADGEEEEEGPKEDVFGEVEEEPDAVIAIGQCVALSPSRF